MLKMQLTFSWVNEGNVPSQFQGPLDVERKNIERSKSNRKSLVFKDLQWIFNGCVSQYFARQLHKSQSKVIKTSGVHGDASAFLMGCFFLICL